MGVFIIVLADAQSNTFVISSTFQYPLLGQINWSPVTRFSENLGGFWIGCDFSEAQQSSKVQVLFPSTISQTMLVRSLDLMFWIPIQEPDHWCFGEEIENSTLGKYFGLQSCTHTALGLVKSLHLSLKNKLSFVVVTCLNPSPPAAFGFLKWAQLLRNKFLHPMLYP